MENPSNLGAYYAGLSGISARPQPAPIWT